MRWWKSSNSPPSSSSSSTASSVSSAASTSRGRESQPRLTRQRKLRYLDDAELGLLASFDSSADPVRSPPPPRSSSSPPVLSPHPLPLPEAAAAAAQLSSVGCPSLRREGGRVERRERRGLSRRGIVCDCLSVSRSEARGPRRYRLLGGWHTKLLEEVQGAVMYYQMDQPIIIIESYSRTWIQLKRRILN
uniref:Uncharacterized protein n=1 Tax=Ananas comosus var. bracteatus TaxID=296719 RepID=A0A6V7PBI9_ANACO|nr:unnamed protein product [Ananas comosus var. bracteatus]